jgi:hypothetical protein
MLQSKLRPVLREVSFIVVHFRDFAHWYLCVHVYIFLMEFFVDKCDIFNAIQWSVKSAPEAQIISINQLLILQYICNTAIKLYDKFLLRAKSLST